MASHSAFEKLKRDLAELRKEARPRLPFVIRYDPERVPSAPEREEFATQEEYEKAKKAWERARYTDWKEGLSPEERAALPKPGEAPHCFLLGPQSKYASNEEWAEQARRETEEVDKKALQRRLNQLETEGKSRLAQEREKAKHAANSFKWSSH